MDALTERVTTNLANPAWGQAEREQLTFLQAQGLLPQHRLLHIGYGHMEAGRWFVEYLNDACYMGIDHLKCNWLTATKVLELSSLYAKHPQVWQSAGFGLPEWSQHVRFEYAWAYSVFTHMLLDRIVLGVRAVMSRLSAGGSFLSSAILGDFLDGGPHATRANERKLVIWPLETLQAALSDVATVDVIPAPFRQSILRIAPVSEITTDRGGIAESAAR